MPTSQHATSSSTKGDAKVSVPFFAGDHFNRIHERRLALVPGTRYHPHRRKYFWTTDSRKRRRPRPRLRRAAHGLLVPRRGGGRDVDGGGRRSLCEAAANSSSGGNPSFSCRLLTRSYLLYHVFFMLIRASPHIFYHISLAILSNTVRDINIFTSQRQKKKQPPLCTWG